MLTSIDVFFICKCVKRISPTSSILLEQLKCFIESS